jgi:F-type H+-transporting ATPase subunit b
MESLIETFHIDVKLLIAQMINFAIVFSVLYFFALKPILKTMKERTRKIEESLENADKIDEKLQKTEEAYTAKLNIAKKDAALIMENAQKQAEERRETMIKKAKEEIGQIINEEKAKMQKEKAITLKEIKSEVVDLVFASMEKILDKKIDSEEEKKLIKKMIVS